MILLHAFVCYLHVIAFGIFLLLFGVVDMMRHTPVVTDLYHRVKYYSCFGHFIYI